MITDKELHEAIAECQGERNPNANTCLKLASYYTILDHIKADEKPPERNASGYGYSYSGGSENVYQSDTEFSQVIENMDMYDVLEIMDELMTTLSVVNPRLYSSVMRKLKSGI